jgi:hypothetical protein
MPIGKTIAGRICAVATAYCGNINAETAATTSTAAGAKNGSATRSDMEFNEV